MRSTLKRGIMIPYIFEPCARKEIVDFIETNHYSHNMNGVMSQYCFKLTDEGGKIVGAMVFGKVGMANAWKKYAEQESDIMELRRLVCIDDTPRNTESWFIGNALRWLKKNSSLLTIVSYADATHNHTGVIYKAANFEYRGMTAKGKMILFNGKMYHDKTIRTKYKGKLKPFAIKIKTALETGNAKYIETKGKHIYVYKLHDKKRAHDARASEMAANVK